MTEKQLNDYTVAIETLREEAEKWVNEHSTDFIDSRKVFEAFLKEKYNKCKSVKQKNEVIIFAKNATLLESDDSDTYDISFTNPELDYVIEEEYESIKRFKGNVSYVTFSYVMLENGEETYAEDNVVVFLNSDNPKAI